MMNGKRAYAAPTLTVHGLVVELTANGSLTGNENANGTGQPNCRKINGVVTSGCPVIL